MEQNTSQHLPELLVRLITSVAQVKPEDHGHAQHAGPKESSYPLHGSEPFMWVVVEDPVADAQSGFDNHVQQGQKTIHCSIQVGRVHAAQDFPDAANDAVEAPSDEVHDQHSGLHVGRWRAPTVAGQWKSYQPTHERGTHGKRRNQVVKSSHRSAQQQARRTGRAHRYTRFRTEEDRCGRTHGRPGATRLVLQRHNGMGRRAFTRWIDRRRARVRAPGAGRNLSFRFREIRSRARTPGSRFRSQPSHSIAGMRGPWAGNGAATVAPATTASVWPQGSDARSISLNARISDSARAHGNVRPWPPVLTEANKASFRATASVLESAFSSAARYLAVTEQSFLSSMADLAPCLCWDSHCSAARTDVRQQMRMTTAKTSAQIVRRHVVVCAGLNPRFHKIPNFFRCFAAHDVVHTSAPFVWLLMRLELNNDGDVAGGRRASTGCWAPPSAKGCKPLEFLPDSRKNMCLHPHLGAFDGLSVLGGTSHPWRPNSSPRI